MIRQQIKQIINIPEAEISKIENGRFGDYSTSIALKLAKARGKNPLETAREIKMEIEARDAGLFEKIAIAGPGFLNFFLSRETLAEELKNILARGEKYGEANVGENKKIQVEFISANPTGPLTIGNGRGGFFGDVLANVLQKAGFEVEREYFINDAGHQIEVLGHSILNDEEAQYKGSYIVQLRKTKELKTALKIKETELSPKELGRLAVVIIWNSMIRPTIEDKMKIKFDKLISEEELHKNGTVKKALRMLEEKRVVYEKEGAIWFRSTEFGDDKDRVLITSINTQKKGEPTYLLADIAYHYQKFIKDKFDLVVDVWGADHHGYMARLQAAGKALGAWDESKLKIVIMQLVRLVKDGQEVKMSKRAGTFVTLDELLEEIPLDVARFFFLAHAPGTHMDFDLDLAKQQSMKNPVYYVQYAYARICSILAKSEIQNPEKGRGPLGVKPRCGHAALRGTLRPKSETNSKSQITNPKLELLIHPAELSLIKQLIRLPEIIEDTAKDFQVQRLTQYALDLVREFHQFYEQCRVIPAPNRAGGSGSGDEDNKDETASRLALCEATRIVLKNVFDLMGISAPEKM